MTIDIGQILTIGGPTSIISVLTYVLINAYLSARKDRREQQTADVATESGYIENAKRVLDLVERETEHVEKRRQIEITRAEKAEERVRELEREAYGTAARISQLERELEWYHEGNRNGRPPFPGR